MPGVASNGGRDLRVSLDSYHLPQAGQPPVSKVLSHHGLLSSLGAWRLGEHPTSRLSTTAPGNNKRKMSKKRPALKLGCWNVWTMMPSLYEDLQDISNTRKTAVINNKLKRLNVNIATLQETWLANAGTLKERDYTFFWQGKSSNEPREHGVGFAVKNSLPQDMRDAKIITLYKNKGERGDCNNYRGISLLSIIGKVYAWVLLICLQKLAEHIYPESQCGF